MPQEKEELKGIETSLSLFLRPIVIIPLVIEEEESCDEADSGEGVETELVERSITIDPSIRATWGGL